MAYIRLVINPRDDEAFKRIVNYPARGIGDITVQRIAQLAAERGQSMWEGRSMRWSPNPPPTPCSGPSPARWRISSP